MIEGRNDCLKPVIRRRNGEMVIEQCVYVISRSNNVVIHVVKKMLRGTRPGCNSINSCGKKLGLPYSPSSPNPTQRSVFFCHPFTLLAQTLVVNWPMTGRPIARGDFFLSSLRFVGANTRCKLAHARPAPRPRGFFIASPRGIFREIPLLAVFFRIFRSCRREDSHSRLNAEFCPAFPFHPP
jgi:hypothetical protein